MCINKDLEEAVRAGNFERFQTLLSTDGADIKHIDKHRNSLLHLSNNVDISKKLFLLGANVHERNRYGDSPLFFAIKSGHNSDVVKELLKHGASVRVLDRKGYTALNLAVKMSNVNLEVIKELLKFGSNINTDRKCYCNSSPLINAPIGPCKELLIKWTLIRNFNEDYRKVVCLDPESEDFDTLSSYMDECASEIFQMETHAINNDLSLYKLVENFFRTDNFSKKFYGFQASSVSNQYLPSSSIFGFQARISSSISKRCVPCSNQMSLKLKNVDFLVQYPIYNDIISDVIEPFLVKANLLTKLSEVQIYTKLDISGQDQAKNKNRIIFDVPITYIIADYLYNDDLSNFISAYSLKRSFEPDASILEASTSKRAKLL